MNASRFTTSYHSRAKIHQQPVTARTPVVYAKAHQERGTYNIQPQTLTPAEEVEARRSERYHESRKRSARWVLS